MRRTEKNGRVCSRGLFQAVITVWPGRIETYHETQDNGYSSAWANFLQSSFSYNGLNKNAQTFREKNGKKMSFKVNIEVCIKCAFLGPL